MEAMTLVAWTFDALLGVGLSWLAWRALACPDLFKAIVLFIAFGLLMALAWVRLEAPDVALAEAAIGAGLTGALLMAALARLRDTGGVPNALGKRNRAFTMRRTATPTTDERRDDRLPEPSPPGSPATRGRPGVKAFRWLALSLLLALASGLGYTVLSLPDQAQGLQSAVAGHMDRSGVLNPVTAVLLNFRGYDTLLEMAVLLLALLGTWSLGSLPPARAESAPVPVLDTLVRGLVPVLVLVAAYLLWAGAHAPGGAFQAGAVLGAAGVLLLLTGWRLPRRLARRPLRIVLAAGVVAFVGVAVVALPGGRQLLEYPPPQAGILILLIEAVATVSIGITLAALFLGAAPADELDQ